MRMSKTYSPEKNKLRPVGLPIKADKKVKKYKSKFDEDDRLEDEDLKPFWANDPQEEKSN